MTYYEIAEVYRKAMDNIEFDEDGVIVNSEALDELEAAIDDKTEAVAIYIKEMTTFLKGIDDEIKGLKSRKDAGEKKINWLKEYLAANMLKTGREKFETTKCKLSFRKSESVDILDDFSIPEKYMVVKTERTPDKTAIKKAIKEGKVIPGAKLIEKQNLQIK